MAIVKSKLLKQLSQNYPNFLKKDLEKFSNIILDEIPLIPLLRNFETSWKLLIESSTIRKNISMTPTRSTFNNSYQTSHTCFSNSLDRERHESEQNIGPAIDRKRNLIHHHERRMDHIIW